MNISLSAEPVFNLGNFAITNSLIATFISSTLLMVTALVISRLYKVIPGKLQNAIEVIYEYIDTLNESIGGEKAKVILPLILSFFFFILVSNWIALIPGFNAVGFFEVHENEKIFVPLLRAATADINTTLALSVISFVFIQYYGIKANEKSYFHKFINLKSPILFFTGILELVSEFSKIISFTFRLFGNVFAGEVLLAVITMLVPYFLPVPFLGLEIFVGIIQAFVFAVLTSVFINLATKAHDMEEEERALEGRGVAYGK